VCKEEQVENASIQKNWKKDMLEIRQLSQTRRKKKLGKIKCHSGKTDCTAQAEWGRTGMDQLASLISCAGGAIMCFGDQQNLIHSRTRTSGGQQEMSRKTPFQRIENTSITEGESSARMLLT